MKELRNINQSLTTLGKVIMKLAQGDLDARKPGHGNKKRQPGG
jgi:hypothetical protein